VHDILAVFLCALRNQPVFVSICAGLTFDSDRYSNLLIKFLCFVQAPCEAEAQCAALVKAGKVYAVGTEDMDALTFGSSVLLRHLTFSEARCDFWIFVLYIF